MSEQAIDELAIAFMAGACWHRTKGDVSDQHLRAMAIDYAQLHMSKLRERGIDLEATHSMPEVDAIFSQKGQR